MKTVGIITEYNPFHLGHAYQCDLLRQMGYEGIVAVMSGNFVQRADVALTDKYRRAEGAVRSGVDLVLELPLPYAIGAAEDFARGGIGILAATGAVEAVCFGSESGDAANKAQYEALCRAEEEGKIRKKMKQGLSYPAACREAVSESGAFWSNEPNDVLGIAYRKAAAKIGTEMKLFAIDRKGSYHGDGNGSQGFESAESIRRRIFAGEEISESLPVGSAQVLTGAPTADLTRMERAILAYYRCEDPSDTGAYYGMREGLAERIFENADAESTEELCQRVKSKRFPYSAVRRALLCGFLKIPKTLPPLSYLRVLAFNGRGQEILKEMKKTATLPIFSTLPSEQTGNPLVKIQLRGDEIFAMTLSSPGPKRWDRIQSAKKIDPSLP